MTSRVHKDLLRIISFNSRSESYNGWNGSKATYTWNPWKSVSRSVVHRLITRPPSRLPPIRNGSPSMAFQVVRRLDQVVDDPAANLASPLLPKRRMLFVFHNSFE